MTDIANDPKGDGAPDESQDGRSHAIQFLARALWREGLVAADRSPEGEEPVKAERGEWKEKRKDYVKLATRLYKRLDRHGGTLTAPVKEAGEDGEAA